jgi:hypothetical protein
MRNRVLVGVAWAALSLSAWAAPAPEEKDYQKIADKEAWEWAKEKASAEYCKKSYKGDYEVELLPSGGDGGGGSVNIRFYFNEKEVYTLVGHAGTVFGERKNVVYYADFTPYSSGCTVIAYDMKAKKQLWKTDLQGLGPIRHTKYHNAVILEVKDDVVRVLGQESAGKYLEYVDLKSGKTVANRIFKDK